MLKISKKMYPKFSKITNIILSVPIGLFSNGSIVPTLSGSMQLVSAVIGGVTLLYVAVLTVKLWRFYWFTPQPSGIEVSGVDIRTLREIWIRMGRRGFGLDDFYFLGNSKKWRIIEKNLKKSQILTDLLFYPFFMIFGTWAHSTRRSKSFRYGVTLCDNCFFFSVAVAIGGHSTILFSATRTNWKLRRWFLNSEWNSASMWFLEFFWRRVSFFCSLFYSFFNYFCGHDELLDWIF